ncbi:MAG: biopolymer transporter ExbD [Planctomycetes bacterium]|nr:biopolymer transporter ExbD [Planctomycetota bacterium]
MAGGGEAEDNPVNLNVVAMVDIIFCLCVFFMCSFKFKQLEGKFQSWLPKNKGVGGAADPGEIKEIRIAMLWDADQRKPRRMFGHKVVGEGEEGIKELETLVRGAYEDWQRKGVPDVPLIIDGDFALPWEEVMAVVNIGKVLEMKNIEFAMGPGSIPQANIGAK